MDDAPLVVAPPLAECAGDDSERLIRPVSLRKNDDDNREQHQQRAANLRLIISFDILLTRKQRRRLRRSSHSGYLLKKESSLSLSLCSYRIRTRTQTQTRIRVVRPISEPLCAADAAAAALSSPIRATIKRAYLETQAVRLPGQQSSLLKLGLR